jgi:polyhydroxyalkanoate synthesis repressor PhaR
MQRCIRRHLLRNTIFVAPHKNIVSQHGLGLHFRWEKGVSPQNHKIHAVGGKAMAKAEGETVIKKYANRRLYNTGTNVTLEDLAKMVKKGEVFAVQDAKTGEDITHSVLTQIIFEQESKTGNTLLPVSFLRQLISFYGDQMQTVVPTFLEQSMHAFTEQQAQMREQMTRAFGETPLGKNFQAPMQMMEDQVRRNTEMFRQAMQMFDELKEQLRNLQSRLDSLGA